MRINDLDYKDNKGNLQQREIERQSNKLKAHGVTDLDKNENNESQLNDAANPNWD